MNTKQIPKKSGGFRTVAVQSAAELRRNRILAWRLTQHFIARSPGIAHGFLPERNCATNAAAHAVTCPKWVLCMDLADFFDSVSADMLLRNGVPADLARESLLVPPTSRSAGGHQPHMMQGWSHSPAAANCASLAMDAALAEYCAARGLTVTRYADDITISGQDRDAVWDARLEVAAIADRNGFKVKHSKTRLQSAAHGRPVITGVAICPDGTIAPTRAARRLARASAHAAAHNPGDWWLKSRARGHSEWCAMKTPVSGAMSKCEIAFSEWICTKL